jgi:tetratricopeptide (TPR) repeat protein
LTDQNPLRRIEERLEQNPHDEGALTEAARFYHQIAMRGDDIGLDRAEEAVAALLKVNRQNAEGLSIAGSLLTMKAKRTGSLFKRMWYSFKAARKLDKAISADPRNVSARTIRAFTALVLPRYLRRLRTAIEDFEYLIEIKSEDPGALPDGMMPKVYYNLGLAHAKLGTGTRAREILEVVISRFPESDEYRRAHELLEKLRLRGY